MKTALLATTLALLTGFSTNAQLGKPRKSVKTETLRYLLDARQAQTKTTMQVNVGDTVFVTARGSVSCGPGIDRLASPATPCGYGSLVSMANEAYNKYPRDDGELASHGALVVLIQDAKGEIVAGEEYCRMPLAPANNQHYIIAGNKGDVVLDINDSDQGNNAGGFNVVIRKSAAYKK